jgi:hypothetical protein
MSGIYFVVLASCSPHSTHSCIERQRHIPVPLDCSAVRVELGLSVVGRTDVTGAGITGSALMMAHGEPHKGSARWCSRCGQVQKRGAGSSSSLPRRVDGSPRGERVVAAVGAAVDRQVLLPNRQLEGLTVNGNGVARDGRRDRGVPEVGRRCWSRTRVRRV